MDSHTRRRSERQGLAGARVRRALPELFVLNSGGMMAERQIDLDARESGHPVARVLSSQFRQGLLDRPVKRGDDKVCRNTHAHSKVAKSHNSLTLSVITVAAIAAASTVTQRGARRAPILRLSAVNITSGTMAKGS